MIETKLINVTNFLRQYESKNTRNSYRIGLKFFFKSIYPESNEDLDILSKRYFSEDRDHREDVMTFKDSMKDKAPATIGNRLIVVRVFLDDNGINFPKRFFKNMNGKRTEAITWEKVPTNEDLKRIVEYLPVQGKALALFLSSSGMRIGETVRLKPEDVEFNRTPVRIKIRAEYTKTGKRRISFISPEAKEAVEEWLKYRDQYVKIAHSRTFKGYKKSDKKLLFPFRAETFNTMWKNALGKAKLLEIDEKTNRVTMRPHNLRKFFRLRVGRYGRDEAECLMGHQAGLNRIYANFDDAEERLEDVYKKSIEDLSIYQGRFKVAQVDKETKNTIKELKDYVVDLVKKGYDQAGEIKYLTIENVKHTKELDQLKSKMMNMEQDLHHWKMTVQDLEKIVTYVRLKMKEEAS